MPHFETLECADAHPAHLWLDCVPKKEQYQHVRLQATV
jgi:hypothetical protein